MSLRLISRAGLPFASLDLLGSLTALTRLELIDYEFGWNPRFVQRLPLQELVIIRCPEVHEQVFVTGGLTSLRKLHVEEV